MRSVISDMDGVIYRGSKLIDGANEFVNRMISNDIKFLFLTNNSEQTPRDLKQKLEQKGIKGLNENNFITSAMATAMFLKQQKENATAYVLGGGGLVNELYNVGFTVSQNNPDYVVVGKTTTNFNFETMKIAVRLIRDGAKFIGTNPDMTDPTEQGIEPACGTILAAIEAASGKKPYIIGKPNSLMMMMAAKKLSAHPEETVMIGDRMDTDIVGGMEAGMKTCLVLSGVSKMEDIEDFPYRPDFVFSSVAEIDPTKL
jgi:NagD protein